MSIASEFDSTIENIKSDYEGLENIGADLTNIDKNIYNIRTCLDNIYSNIPKTTGEGSNLSLSTIKGRINVDNIKGDTEQDTYEGYNLLVYPYNYLNGNGTSLDKNIEGDLEVTGTTTTSGMAHFFLTNAVELKTNTTYTITRTIETLSGTATSATGQIELYIGNTWKKAVLFNNQTSATFTVDDNAVYRIIVKLGSLSETSKFKIGNFMIYEGTETKTFQKYYGGQASPNPTYPQDIEVVTGQQEVVVSNKNLITFDSLTDETALGIEKTFNSSEMKLNGTSTGAGQLITNNSPLNITIPAGTYKITYKLKSGTATRSTGNDIAFYLKDETSGLVAITLWQIIGASSQSISATITTTESKSLAFYSYCNASGIVLNNVIIQVQLEKGSTSTSYVEHQEQTKTLHLGDIELSKIGTYQDRIFETSGKNLTDIVLNGSTTGEITYKTYTLQPNTQYTISTNTWVTSTSTANVFASGGTSFSPSSSSNGVNGSRTITSDNNGNITIGYRNVNMSMDYSSGKYWVMLNEGSTALPYEPYGSDKWYIEKNIGKYTINGSETITSNPNGTNSYFVAISGINRTSSVLNTICNYFRGIKFDDRASGGNNTIYSEYNADKVTIRNTTFTTIESITTFLTSNTPILYYVKTTPTYEEITNETLKEELNEIEKMMSYNGQTNISISGNLPMILNVSALKGE